LWRWCSFRYWIINRWYSRLALQEHWRSLFRLVICRSQISSFCYFLECINYGILNCIR
jgi:hypothetical protein